MTEEIKNEGEELVMAPVEDKRHFLIKLQAETAGKAGEEILKLIGTKENLFLLSDKVEDQPKYNAAYQDLLGEILVIFTKHNVALTNYGFVFNGIKAVVDSLQQTLNNHTEKIKFELQSRTVGAKNPYDGKYDVDYSTHKELTDALIKVREATGDNPNDFFTVEK